MSLFSRLFGGGRAGRLRSIGFTATAQKQIDAARERSEDQAEEHRAERDRRRRTNEVLEARRAQSDAGLSADGKTFLASYGQKGKELSDVMNDKDYIKLGKQIKSLKNQQGARANLKGLLLNLYAQAKIKGENDNLASPYATPAPVAVAETEPQEDQGFFARMQDAITGRGEVDQAREERAAEEARTAELTQPDTFTPPPGDIPPLPKTSDDTLKGVEKITLEKAWLRQAKVKGFEYKDDVFVPSTPEAERIFSNNLADVNQYYLDFKKDYKGNIEQVAKDARIIAFYQAMKKLNKEDIKVSELNFDAEEAKAEIAKYGEGREAIKKYLQFISKDIKKFAPGSGAGGSNSTASEIITLDKDEFDKQLVGKPKLGVPGYAMTGINKDGKTIGVKREK